MRKKDNRK